MLTDTRILLIMNYIRNIFILCLTALSTLSFSQTPTSIPLLEPDFVLGTTLYGSADLEALNSKDRSLLDALVNQGLGGFTYYVDWMDLENEAQEVQLGTFTDTLERLHKLGLVPFVNITVGDSGGYNLPSDLLNDSGALLSPELLAETHVIERFGRILDELIPVLSQYGGFYLSLGNEMGEYLDLNELELQAYVQFVTAAKTHIQSINPDMAVGVTLTIGDILTSSKTLQAFKPVVDVIPFNQGPIRADFSVYPTHEIRTHFEEVLAAYGGGTILIQELTCPSPETMGASPAWQAECYEILLDVIRETPDIRFASIFSFQDFSDETCDLFRDALFGEELDGLPQNIAQILTDYTCYLGLIDGNSQPKPAYEVILKNLQQRP
ncbi:MAG: hypothetical protein AAF267_07335 [Deinococcota bacterium]